MKTSSKILIAVVLVFMSAGAGAQSISKNKRLTNKFNPWQVIVNYDADHSRGNYYLLSVNNEEYGKKRDGSYFQTYSFFGTAEELIEFIEEAKIALQLEKDETYTFGSKIGKEAGCRATKNIIRYDSKVSGDKFELAGYSWVMKDKYLEELILKIQKFEDESQGD